MFPRDMVCLRNISVDTLHKGHTEDDDDDNNNNNNNNIAAAATVNATATPAVTTYRAALQALFSLA
jgi:hypothetical protein